MKILTAEFETSATDLRSCPKHPAFPEFAFIGRSNVGKSSLINMLADRRSLAKVSGTPGKTRLLNFFRINNAWFLVDLPGYGFAKGARSESYDFSTAVANYLEHRDRVRRVFVLIDSMLPPQAIDVQFLRWLSETGVAHALVFTKTDRQSPTATRKSVDAFLAVLDELDLPHPPVHTCSAKEGAGRKELLNAIAEDIAKAPKPTTPKAGETSRDESSRANDEHEATSADGRPVFKPGAKAAKEDSPLPPRAKGPRVWRP